MTGLRVETSPAAAARAPGRKSRPHWWVLGSGLAVAVLVISYGVYLALHWPFTEESVIDALQEATLRTVTIEHFHQTVFPIGCVAEGVRFERHMHKDKQPIIEIGTLTVKGSYIGLLTAQYRLHLVKMVRMHVTVPPAEVHGKPDPIMPLNRTSSVHTLKIDTIVADGTVLDFAHEDGSKPYRIVVEKATAEDVGNNSPISYVAVIKNALPPGEIRSKGVFGPWEPKNPGSTPLHGSYSYSDANLAAFRDISGRMEAAGTFQGLLNQIHTSGTADVKKFQVSDTAHARELKASFQALVDGIKGNISLESARASFDDSVVLASGTIGGQDGGAGKTIALELRSDRGRIEDILRLFISAERSPLMGAVAMQAHLEVPPGKETFLERMHMWGDFGVTGGHFTDGETQADINRLSQSATKQTDAPGDKNGMSVSDLKGHGDVRNAVATLTHLSFQVPGATAKMQGTYNLSNYDVNLHGLLYTDGSPAAAMTGFKSWVLRAVTPFLKKQGNTRIVPFKITGNYQKTNIGLDLSSKH